MIVNVGATSPLIESYHDFYVAAASVAGALIGLLFVAMSVAQERKLGPGERALHEIRATSALTCFSNTLVVSLFTLMPEHNAGSVLTSVSILGLLTMLRSLLRLVRMEREHQRDNRTDGGFVVVQTLWFLSQLTVGVLFNFSSTNRADLYEWMAIFVVVFFLTGIARSWQLIGGPELSLRDEARGLLKDEHGDDQDAR